MLQHDRHFVRIKLAHPRRKPHAPRMGTKTDVKVMLPRNPIARHIGKDFPHDPAHGVLDKKIVSDQVSRHSTVRVRYFEPKLQRRLSNDLVSESGGFCCQVPPDPALKCYLQGLNFGTITALRGNSHRSIVVVSNYNFGPMTAEPCRAKDRPLHSPSNLFRPRRNPSLPRLGSRLRAWVEAPGTAPGSEELISTSFIAIAAQGGGGNISVLAHFSKRNGKRRLDPRRPWE